MANTDFEIHANVNLTVDERTAKTCLRLVEIYLNDHDGTGIKATQREDGSVGLYFWGASEQVKAADAHGPEVERLNAELSGARIPIYPPQPLDLKKKTGGIHLETV